MGEHNVYVGLIHTLERALQSLDDMLPAETAGVGLLTSGTKEDLGGEDILVTGPCELLEGLDWSQYL